MQPWYMLEGDYPDNHRELFRAAYLRYRQQPRLQMCARALARNEVYGLPLPTIDPRYVSGTAYRAIVRGTDGAQLEAWLLHHGCLEPHRWVCTFTWEADSDPRDDDTYGDDCYTSRDGKRPHGAVPVTLPGGRRRWFVAPTWRAPKGMSRGAAAVWQAQQRKQETEAHAEHLRTRSQREYVWVSCVVEYDGTLLSEDSVGSVEVGDKYTVEQMIADEMWPGVLCATRRTVPGLRAQLLEEFELTKQVLQQRLSRLA